MGSDIASFYICASFDIFQSTLPHGERPSAYYRQDIHRNFNPRPPHGERPLSKPIIIPCSTFQSTPPAWGATGCTVTVCSFGSFQSTLPAWGATSWSMRFFPEIRTFQSTLPAWGATFERFGCFVVCRISIHAPHMGSDKGRQETFRLLHDFNPRSPHGERQSMCRSMCT